MEMINKIIINKLSFKDVLYDYDVNNISSLNSNNSTIDSDNSDKSDKESIIELNNCKFNILHYCF